MGLDACTYHVRKVPVVPVVSIRMQRRMSVLYWGLIGLEEILAFALRVSKQSNFVFMSNEMQIRFSCL